MHTFSLQLTKNVIMNISAFSLLITMINLLPVLPFIFNHVIIPKIEKKIGKRLQFDPIYDSLFLWGNYFVRYLVVSMYIMIKISNFSFLKLKRNALEKANYRRELITNWEIFWSLITLLNAIVFWVSLLLLMKLVPR